MIQGEQSGYTTRIYEFGVYGKPRTVTAIQQPTTVAPTSAIRLLGNSPNPCHGSTQIRCQVPAGIQRVALNILSYDGRIVCREDYQVSEGDQTLLWSGHLPNGIYLYRSDAPVVGPSAQRNLPLSAVYCRQSSFEHTATYLS